MSPYKAHEYKLWRDRTHVFAAMLVRATGMSVTELGEVFEVDRGTANEWTKRGRLLEKFNERDKSKSKL